MATKTLFSESEDLLNICWDNVFKAVFTKETRDSRLALSRLVSAIIGRELEALNTTANEPAAENAWDRQVRFDINCRARDGERVNVEMCLNPDDFEPVRLEFYSAKLFCGQDIRGRDKTYDDLKRTYQIAILVRKTFFPDGDFFHQFEYYDPDRSMPLGGRTRIFTLELSKLGEVAKKPAEKMSNAELLAVFFRYLTDPSMREKINEIAGLEEGIAMAGEVLLDISRDEDQRAWLMSEYKGAVDLQSKLVNERRKSLETVARNALAEGASIDFIQRITALDAKTIESLQAR